MNFKNIIEKIIKVIEEESKRSITLEELRRIVELAQEIKYTEIYEKEGDK